MEKRISNYFDTLARVVQQAMVTDVNGKPMARAEAYAFATRAVRTTHDAGNKLMFIGNGGSAGISSHMAIDYSKNGGIRSLAFNDGAALTCLGNDLGYENVFKKPIEILANKGDILVSISSSGRSKNILQATKAAIKKRCFVITLSGFGANNPLRRLGDINFYINSHSYGYVEIAHLSICHCLLDMTMGKV